MAPSQWHLICQEANFLLAKERAQGWSQTVYDYAKENVIFTSSFLENTNNRWKKG